VSILGSLDFNTVAAVLWVGFSTLVLIALLILRGRKTARPIETRQLPAFRDLRRVVGEAAEKGGTISIALGSGGLEGEDAAISLAGFQLLEALAADLASYHTPPIITVGDPTLLALAQDVVQRAYERRGLADQYDPNTVRYVAPSAVGYAAGTAEMFQLERTAASVVIGAFGAEVVLIADGASRHHIPQMAAAASPQAVGALYPATDHLAIGEEIFAAGAQISHLRRSLASLAAEDVLRVAVVVAILVSSFLALIRGSL